MTKDSVQNAFSLLILMFLAQAWLWKDPFHVTGLDFLSKRDEARVSLWER